MSFRAALVALVAATLMGCSGRRGRGPSRVWLEISWGYLDLAEPMLVVNESGEIHVFWGRGDSVFVYVPGIVGRPKEVTRRLVGHVEPRTVRPLIAQLPGQGGLWVGLGDLDGPGVVLRVHGAGKPRTYSFRSMLPEEIALLLQTVHGAVAGDNYGSAIMQSLIANLDLFTTVKGPLRLYDTHDCIYAVIPERNGSPDAGD